MATDTGIVSWEIEYGFLGTLTKTEGLEHYTDGGPSYLFAGYAEGSARFIFNRLELGAADGAPIAQNVQRYPEGVALKALYVESNDILWAIGEIIADRTPALFTINFSSNQIDLIPLFIA